tara:strand:- start:789 stop:1694 length:906 start_codon:yes stop_codon:yes gene_type:complete
MKLIQGLKINKKFKNSVIAIGNFDGLHLGHKKTLLKAKLKAKKLKLKFGVVTFEPIPVMFFNKKIKNHRINNLDQKILFLKKLKIDFLYIVKFTKRFSYLTADKFIKNILYRRIKCKYIFISKNFKFGKNRKGNIYTLKEYEKLYNYKTIIINPFKFNNKVLSSSLVRRKIMSGKLDKANILLGRDWSIQGRVIKGAQRGRKIGFPTCNIELNSYVIPKLGVYSVNVKIGKIFKKGIANIGFRPTFRGKNLLLEVNIFGLKANLYKRILEINFKKFIRGEKKFKNINELKLQIKKDINKVK